MDQEKAASAKMANLHACCGYNDFRVVPFTSANGFEFHYQLVPWQPDPSHQYCWKFLAVTQTPYVVNTSTNSWATAKHCSALPDCAQSIAPSELNEVRHGKLKRRKERYIAKKLTAIKNIAKETQNNALGRIADDIAFCLTPGLESCHEASGAVGALDMAKIAYNIYCEDGEDSEYSEETLKTILQKCIYKIRDLVTVRVQIDALPIGCEDSYRKALSRAHSENGLEPKEYNHLMLSYWKIIVKKFADAFPTNQMKENRKKGHKRPARKRKNLNLQR